ncbi:MAG: Sec23 Sec24 family [Lasallia pustulata]|uniref:Sec23 Sec24 family n=1 Tax=Lasallia pustulata TaxID=136370 RepID=A0A5M8PX59_9LECA|nr:MAG: Sec23 Sec24 family [Lasallia pustulata]
MSDYAMYHALGGQRPESDPRHPQPQTQPAPPQFHPPGASAPPGYQQSGSSYGQMPPNLQPNQFRATPQGGYQPQGSALQEQGYLPSQGQLGAHEDGAMGGLAEQMGSMNFGGEAPGVGRANKKKNRHAYHNLEQSTGSSQAFNGIPQGGVNPTQFLNADPSHPYAGQPITPAMSQFPAPANGPFTPGGQQTSMDFSARPNFGGTAPAIPTLSGPGVSAQGRVDPEQIPSIPRSRDGPAKYYLDHVYPTMEQHLPPPGAVPFVAHDQGNSSPKFARLTLNNIPSTSEALTATALPLGLVLQPLALLQAGEHPIPVLDFGETGPPRCRRCRAYINPFMTFRSGGNKLVCNMCTFPNEVAPEYFAPTDPSGVRVDRAQRPELTMGTVEFMVPKEYWAKEPVGLRWLFLIDVGQEAVNRGWLESFCEGILNALYSEEEGGFHGLDETSDRTEIKRNLPLGSKVGFVTFDKDVHFYNCNPNLDQAQMLVMSDIDDPFVPLGSNGLFVDPYESKSIISSLLTRIPDLFSRIKNPEPALLPTLNAALSALSLTGGKVVCSLSALPTWGPGRLFMRDEGKLHNIETEKKLFTTDHPGWKKTASKMVESGVGVDFFIGAAGGGYMDIATIGHVSAVTGGETFFYPNFHAPRDRLKLSKEVKHCVTRETGYQALMKVRCSNGLQVSSYHGNFLQHTFGADLEFGVIDADKAIGVIFSYDGKLDAKFDAHFQCALLYTTASGERRVRCTNTVASVSEGALEGMRYIDQDAVVNMIAKEAATKMTERTLKDIRSALTEKTVDILAGYRKSFSGSHPPGQLVLPENLKEFSMYMLGLLKSRAFKAGSEPSDRRAHTMRMIKSMGALELSLFLYPRILPLHNLAATDGFPSPQTGHLVVPPAIRASFSRIEEGGAYLVDDGQVCLLWLHSQVSPNLLEDLFGEGKTSLPSLDPALSALPVLDTHLNAQVRNLLAYWGGGRGSKAATVQLARQGLDGSEFEFARLLVEDRNNEAQSYVDWLVHVHRCIQLELAGQRKREDGGLAGVGESLGGAASGIAGLRPSWL